VADTLAVAHADRKQQQRERDRLRRRVAELEARIAANEAALAAIDADLVAAATDGARVAALAIERDAAERRLAAELEAWEEAAAAAEALG
jgi:uncharacterized coiled-coil protein SlyX